MKNNIEIRIDEVYQQLLATPLEYGHGTDNPWDEAMNLVLEGLGLPLTSDLNEIAEQPVTREQRRLVVDCKRLRCVHLCE